MDQHGSDVEGALDNLPALPTGAEAGFFKAVAYFFGSVTNYAGAWARRPTQAVEDKTDARSLVAKSVAEAAAKQASEDPEIVAAALASYLPKELRRQRNKARVVEEAASALSEKKGLEPPGKEIEDDWLNAFERYCEDASSEKMQQMWGRVLAGQVVKPDSFSKATIRLISELDQETAELFEEVNQFVISGHVFVGERNEDGLFTKLLHLESMGLLSGATGMITWSQAVDEKLTFHLAGEQFGLVGKVDKGDDFSLEAIPLTKIGKEIARILPRTDEVALLKTISSHLKERKADFLNKSNVVGIALCERKRTSDSDVLSKTEILWGVDPFERDSA